MADASRGIEPKPTIAGRNYARQGLLFSYSIVTFMRSEFLGARLTKNGEKVTREKSIFSLFANTARISGSFRPAISSLSVSIAMARAAFAETRAETFRIPFSNDRSETT